MHNAATIAGMAFANAFLGLVHSLAHKIGAEYHLVHGETCAILLPHVIKYNGVVPTKLSVWPKYEEYQCDKKYLEICQMLGLKATTPEEGTKALSDAVMALGKEIGIDMNFQHLVPDEKTWEKNLESISYLAYEDQCTPANPRLPLVSDMQQIMRDAYKGN
jgi:acetaldehyde dehydrogenase/alcohol dehydrogenase